MSKNTSIADLINYISVDGSGNVVLTTGGQVATQSYVTTALSNLVNSAPSTLDTLNELAAALGNDANFATTITTSIGTKVPQTRTITINGTTLDLSADRSFTVSGGVSGSGSTGYLPKFTASGTIGNTVIYENNGFYGVNTTSPVAPLHLRNTLTSGAYNAGLALDSVISGDAVDIFFGSSNPAALRIYASNTALTSSPGGAGFQLFKNTSANFPGQVYFDSGAHNNAALIFRTAPTSGTITERLRITSGGNVGIGTTAPSASLDIRSGGPQLRVGISGGGYVELSDNQISAKNSSNAGSNLFINVSGANTILNRDSGNVGIGVVPQGVGSTKTLEIGSRGLIYDNNDNFAIVNNGYNNGTWKYKQTGFAVLQATDGGNFSFSTATSGSINSTITFIERMRLTNNGALKVSNNGIYLSNTAPYHEFTQTNTDTNITILRNTAASPYGDYIGFSSSPNNTTNYFLAMGDVTNDKFIIWSNGSAVNRTGSYGTISDARYKENIIDATSKLKDIMQLRVRNFNMIGDSAKQIGFIAQEFEEVFPSMIDTSIDKESGNEYKSIKTSVLIPMLVKSIQELKAENDELREILNRNNII